MDERILKWLYDIKFSIEEINGYFHDGTRDFHLYKENIMLKRAVERNLEIIGEAVNRILKRDESFLYKIADAKAIVGLRNQVIHAYDSVSDENIWSVITTSLPRLEKEVKILIEENPSS